MKILSLFFFLCIFSVPGIAQRDSINTFNRIGPVGFCPPVPNNTIVSFMITVHSSDPSEIKIYYEGKIKGNALPPYWIKLISELPGGSTVIYSDMVVIQNGAKGLLPIVRYTLL